MIVAYSTELKNAFIEHSKNYKENTSSHYLLLFYAVECGLKYLIVSRNGKKPENSSTNQSNNVDYPKITTHEIDVLLEYCEMAKQYKIKNCKTVRGINEQVTIQDLHTAWRYGVELDSESEKEAIEQLSKIQKNIKKKIDNGIILKTKYTR